MMVVMMMVMVVMMVVMVMVFASGGGLFRSRGRGWSRRGGALGQDGDRGEGHGGSHEYRQNSFL
jgi:hypothetical protein